MPQGHVNNNKWRISIVLLTQEMILPVLPRWHAFTQTAECRSSTMMKKRAAEEAGSSDGVENQTLAYLRTPMLWWGLVLFTFLALACLLTSIRLPVMFSCRVLEHWLKNKLNPENEVSRSSFDLLLTCPSLPGNEAVILARGQKSRAICSSLSRTKSPTWRFLRGSINYCLCGNKVYI